MEAGIIRNFELGFSTVLQLYVLEDGAKKEEEENSHYALCTHSLTADPGNQASESSLPDRLRVALILRAAIKSEISHRTTRNSGAECRSCRATRLSAS